MRDLMYLLLPYTLTTFAASTEVMTGVIVEITPELLVEVTTEVTAEVTAEVLAEVPAEVTAKVMPEVPSEVTSKVTAEVTPEVLAEVPAEVTAKVTPEVSSEVTSEVTVEVTPEVPFEVTSEVIAEVTAEELAEVPAEVTAEVTPEVLAEVPTEVTAEVTPEVASEVASEVTSEVTSEVPSEGLADGEWEWMEALGQGIKKEIQSVKQPIEEAIINMGTTTCENMQKLLGMSYEQMKGENAPNLNSLSLVYKTRYFTTIINITTAPEALSRVREFDKDQRLIIFVHGFTDDPTKVTFDNLTRAFFVSKHLSLLALDASPLIRWLYYRSSTYVRFIGQKLGQVLAATVERGQDPSLIHIIGFSLGGHIAGFAGKHFLALTGRRLGRISGLDPAGPCFTHVHPDMRLRHTDAMYVDVIHTDAGVFGIKDAVGHKDYYPNGGSMQPNCMRMGCSHSRTWLLYGESVINPLAFPAVRCQDWDSFKKGECDPEISYMGYSSTPDGKTGSYFLQTGATYPYTLGLDGIQYRDTDGFVQTLGSLLG